MDRFCAAAELILQPALLAPSPMMKRNLPSPKALARDRDAPHHLVRPRRPVRQQVTLRAEELSHALNAHAVEQVSEVQSQELREVLRTSNTMQSRRSDQSAVRGLSVMNRGPKLEEPGQQAGATDLPDIGESPVTR
jgi:hypothetical protein